MSTQSESTFCLDYISRLCGLAILAVGILIRSTTASFDQIVENVSLTSTTLLVVGAIIFIIAFFGCCGAIRESHCMTITYACLLLAILFIQVAVAVWTFVHFKDVDKINVDQEYSKLFEKYWNDQPSREIVDAVQKSLECCGKYSSRDYSNGTIPWSCCGAPEGTTCSINSKTYDHGCIDLIKKFISKAVNVLGGLALGVAGVELVGIIFALCLANSIRNADRRGYRV